MTVNKIVTCYRLGLIHHHLPKQNIAVPFASRAQLVLSIFICTFIWRNSWPIKSVSQIYSQSYLTSLYMQHITSVLVH